MVNPKQRYYLLIFLIFSILIRAGFAIFVGPGNSDASNYTTYAYDIAYTGNFKLLFIPQSPGPVINLWVLLMSIFMFSIGSHFLTVAVILTIIVNIMSLFVFYKLLNIYLSVEKSLLATFILSILPLHIKISYNPSYESFMILIVLLHLLFLIKYIKSGKYSHLITSALSGSSLVLIHNTGYLFIFLSSLFMFYTSLNRSTFKKWLIFVIILCTIPLGQFLIWKINTGSFWPYLQFQKELRINVHNQYLNMKSIPVTYFIKYFENFIRKFNPILFLYFFISLIHFKWLAKKKNYQISTLILISAVILFLLFLNLPQNYLTLGLIILISTFLYFSSRLIEKYNVNELLLYSFYSIFIYMIIFLRPFPRGLNTRSYTNIQCFALIVAVFLIFNGIRALKYILIIGIIIIQLTGISFSRFGLKDKVAFWFKTGTYGYYFEPWMPYYLLSPELSDSLQLLNSLKNIDIKKRKIITNLFYGRFLGMKYQIPQSRILLIKNDDNYNKYLTEAENNDIILLKEDINLNLVNKYHLEKYKKTKNIIVYLKKGFR